MKSCVVQRLVIYPGGCMYFIWKCSVSLHVQIKLEEHVHTQNLYPNLPSQRELQVPIFFFFFFFNSQYLYHT